MARRLANIFNLYREQYDIESWKGYLITLLKEIHMVLGDKAAKEMQSIFGTMYKLQVRSSKRN